MRERARPSHTVLPGPAARRVATDALLGSVVGLLLLHPVSMVLYWWEYHPGSGPALEAALSHLVRSFSLPMLLMAGLYVSVGAGLAVVTGAHQRARIARDQRIAALERELSRDLRSLLHAGEGARLELKSTLRWDLRQGKVSRAIEGAALKTIAGFMNGQGGILILGVDDAGSIVGLSHDYQTLRRSDRDGFEQLLTTMIATRLGADVCRLVTVLFHEAEGEDVCRVVVEPSPRPVFLDEGGSARLYLRTGNSTRQLDAREVANLVGRRWPDITRGAA